MSAVTFVIPSYNGESVLPDCLRSISNLPEKPSVIVVDNASTDRSARLAEEAEDCIVLRQPKNLGFGRASNIGLRHALDSGADWVLLLNQDTKLQPDALSRLLDAVKQHPAAGVLVPLQLRSDEKSIDRIFLQNYLAVHAHALIDASVLEGRADPVVVRSTPAAAWLMSRRALETVGGFDPIFFMYGEDDDYAHRLHRQGLTMLLVPSSRYTHLRTAYANTTQETSARRVRRIGSRTRAQLIASVKTHQNPGYKVAFQGSVKAFTSALGLFVAHGDWITLAGALGGIAQFVRALPTALRNCKVEQEAKPHWL